MLYYAFIGLHRGDRDQIIEVSRIIETKLKTITRDTRKHV